MNDKFRIPCVIGALTLLLAPETLARPSRAVFQLQSATTSVRVVGTASGPVIQTLSPTKARKNWADGPPMGTQLVSTAIKHGKRLNLRWSLKRAFAKDNRHVVFEFACLDASLLAVSSWSACPGVGPIEHSLSFINTGKEPVELPLQKSLCWSFKSPSQANYLSSWVEKAAGKPSETGFHQSPLDPDHPVSVLSRPYVSDELAYSKASLGRDAVPWLTVSDRTSQTGWYAGIEFSGRVSLDVQPSGKGQWTSQLGLANEDKGKPAFRTILGPGEKYPLPTVFVGCFQGGVEAGTNQMKHWVSDCLRPKTTDPHYPLLTLNTWGSDMGINATLSKAMMKKARTLGMELFHVDAGWFRSVGDWRANRKKFPDGMRAVSDQVHSLGMKFGLWVGWTQGGIQDDPEDRASILNVHAPDRADWFTHDYPLTWKPADFVGADLCLADPKAQKWCTDLLRKIVRENRVDMLEHDQRMIVEDCVRTDHGHSATQGDTAFRASNGYYAVYDRIRSQFPNLMFEDCVNGGRMVDYGAAKRVNYFSICDSYDPLSNRRAISDLTWAMPAAMCECYVMAMPNKTIGEFKTMLRSGLMGWCSIMQDPTKWTPEQSKVAKQEFDNYRNSLRPLILNGDVYHVSARPDGMHWDGLQYVSRDQRSTVLYAFRGKNMEASHAFVLQGLKPDAHYRVHFQDRWQSDYLCPARTLMKKGLEVRLSESGASQIVTLEQIR